MENRERHRQPSRAAALAFVLARLLLLLCLPLFPLVGAAQTTPRDYSITLPQVSYAPDGGSAFIYVGVTNEGGDAAKASQIVIAEYQSGRVAARQELPALAADEERDFTIELPLRDLADEGIVSFTIEAGIDEFELANSQIAQNNSQLFYIDQAAAREGSGAGSSSRAARLAQPLFDIYIPIVNLGVKFYADGIQLNDRRLSGQDILVALGLLALALFVLWLLGLTLRRIFRAPPSFGLWQPPYAVNNWHDPNSALGRRQAWQFHAQNSLLSPPSGPEQVTVVKRLLDERGVALGGWRVTAMRSAQYDVYGRINRSEVLMPLKLIGQVNRLIRRAPKLERQERLKAAQPIANRLSRRALGPVDRQNFSLPIALEMRFEGGADDIRILFELYHCRSGAWHRIDQWAPELGQIGEIVPEQYSFSLNGQLPGESQREFKRRLGADVARLLGDMLDQNDEEKSKDWTPANASSLEDSLDGAPEGAAGAAVDEDTDPYLAP